MYLLRSRSSVVLLLLAFVFGMAAKSAFGVDVNGRIRGTVTDPSGAVVSGASVVATNVATGVKYPTKSLSTGDYLLPQLPVGTYSITVTAPGFKSFQATGIVLTIDQEYTEPVQLQVGGGNETLEVAADAVQVNTTDMQLNNVVNSQQMVELPLINRAFTGLELIEPGVQASSDRFGTYSVSGAETQQSEFLVNGADTNDLALNTLALSPNIDAIDQFNLIEGPLNAEYDRNSGGIVSATIKQGSNYFHGDVFEFYRDTFLNTGNYFTYNTTTHTKTVTPYHQNIFGGTLGGPIFRDKLFFFGAYQGTRQRVPGTNGGGSTTVFTAAQRAGNFSADAAAGGSNLGYSFNLTNPIPGTLNLASCPGATTWGACIAVNGGVFTPADFNAISVKLLNTYVPQPNSGTNTYIFNSVTSTSADQYIGRIDYSLNPKNQITVLGIYQKQAVTSNIPFTGASLPGFGEVDAQHIQQWTFDFVHQFSATLVNDFAMHYTRFNYAAVNPQSTIDPATYGFDIHPELTSAESLPLISTGYFSLGFSSNGPQPRIDQVAQADDNISKSFGHHQLKFGYDGRKYNVWNPFGASNSGNYSFSAGSPYSTGDPGLDFLLGIPSTYSQGSGAEIEAQAYLNYLYGQDTWKVSNSLTLNYGLGYQIDTVLHNDQYGGEAVVCFIPGQQSTVFPTAPKDINYPGDPGCTNASQAYTRFGDLGPRIGFAWSPDLGWISAGNSHKFAVRGGFGIYYDRSEEETSLNNLETPPFGLSSGGALDYPGTTAPAFGNPYEDINTGTVYTNKFPYTFPTKGSNPNFGLYEPLGVSLYAPGFRSPYAENFQISIERELPSRLVTRITYEGSLGRHNQNVYEGNPITQAGHDACLADTTYCGSHTTQAYRANQAFDFPNHTAYGYTDPNSGVPAFISMGYVTTEASSNYNALQVSLEKAPTHGLSFQVSYTYSHAMDTASSYENAGYGSSGRGYNQFVPTLNYGDSTFDSRNRLVIAPIYITPTRSSSSWYSPVNLALAGWEVSGITTLAQGFPFDISYAGSSANSMWCAPDDYFYACPDEPNIVGPLQRTNPRVKLSNGRTEWFVANTATFQAAPLGQFGTAHRDPFHGPGINNTNLILAKNIYFSSERNRYVQLRMESDNVFNHTQFSNPASSFSTTAASGLNFGSAGQISGAANARLTQLAAKIYF